MTETPDKLPSHRYRVLAPLVAGTVGSVYRALDTMTHREVVLKQVSPVEGNVRYSLFLREARILKSLSNPRFARFVDFYLDEGGNPTLVQELIDGIPLDQWQVGRTTGEILSVYGEIAEALAGLHHSGIVHRDLKPANVLVCPTWPRVRILDLGFASQYDRPDPLVSDTETILGTPKYISPEALIGTAIGPAADVYSLGLMVCEALTGMLPGAGTSLGALLVSKAAGEINVSSLRTHAVEPVYHLVASMVARDPRERPAAEMAALRLYEEAHLDPTLPDGYIPERIEIQLQPAFLPSLPPLIPEKIQVRGIRLYLRPLIFPLVLLLFSIVLLARSPRYLARHPSNTAGPPQYSTSSDTRSVIPLVAAAITFISGVVFLVSAIRLRRIRAREAPGKRLEARIHALEEKVTRVGDLSASMAIELSDIHRQLGTEELGRIVRQAVAAALRDSGPTSDLGKSLDLLRKALEERPSWDKRLTTIAAFGAGAVAATGGVVSLLITTRVWIPNSAPVIRGLGPPGIRIVQGSPLELHVDAIDPDGDPLTFTYDTDVGNIAGTGASALLNVSPSCTSSLVRVNVRVSDGRKTATFTEAFRVNHPPDIHLQLDRDPLAPEGVTIEAVGTDLDGDRLTYKWASTCKSAGDTTAALFYVAAPCEVSCDVGDGWQTVHLRTSVKAP